MSQSSSWLATQDWTTNQEPALLIDSTDDHVYNSKVSIPVVRMVLTEVVNDSNIQYLNPDDEDEPGTQLYVTQAHQHQTCSFNILRII